jgi:glycine oxidase
VSNLNKIISCPYEIIDHKSNIRSSVYDRKQIIGQHNEFKNVYIFNGLGSRGILTAPLLSHWLYQSIENNFTIPNEVNVARFD